MNTFKHLVRSLLLAALLSLAALTAVADDTELFVATSNPLLTGVQPNILFIYDNSGSMDSEVLTQLPWNPDTTWTGCYDSNRTYYTTGTNPPGCSTGNWFAPSLNYCNASQASLRSAGQFRDQMQEWRTDVNQTSQRRWVDVSTGQSRGRPKECQHDAGQHGQVSGTYYAANGANGPWSGSLNQQIAWGSVQQVTFWNGNWLNWNTGSGTIHQTRMQIIRDVTTNLLQDMNGVNVGLMQFNDNQGGTVSRAMENISTARTAMQSAVNALTPETWTPLSETLYEAANYYMGRNVDYGNTGPIRSVAASRTSGTITGTTYRRPATYACQKNYIVLLTDGLPTQDVSGTAKIRALPNWATTVTHPNCSMTGDGACMIDLAEYLNKHDLDPSLPGLQNVTTYTIGFGVDLAVGDSSFLQATAAMGGGRYYPAGDTASLTSALTAIVTDILDDATMFSAPTAPVNAFNRTQNLSDVFVSLFAPSVNRHWPGNLKKYRLEGGQLVDVNGASAVNSTTGFFADTSQSYWSDSVDGNAVQQGGAANELPVSTARNLYTNLNGNHLNTAGNAISVANTGSSGITAARIGAPNDTERDRVINWARGLDLNDENDNGNTTDVRHAMGDPLHVRPVMVIYGGTQANPDATVFVSTNDGYLHAINPADGSELWAFIPQELLGRLYDLYLDDVTPTRSYGLDGEITVSIENNDNVAGISGNERVLMYFGMRRGGNSVFALDVTDRNDPQFLWRINSSTAGFAALGQTWSTPVISSVNIGGAVRRVAIFGGGYDAGQDAAGYRVDPSGNAIYMVDAGTGQLLWLASSSCAGVPAGVGCLPLGQMHNSIPAPIQVLDLNSDQLADRMYVGDTGGQVWRFDIINGMQGNNLVKGGLFASLGAAGQSNPTLPNVRRFYVTPDVARIASGLGGYLSISLGSGHREHPLDTVTDDEFYSLRDFHVFDVLENTAYTQPIVRTDLTDITGNVAPTLAYNSLGWRLRLDMSAGEKVMNSSRTVANQLYFTSFSPGNTGDACIAAGGSNRLYIISVRDGAPVQNLDGSVDAQNFTVDDRSRVLPQTGIAPEVTFFFTQNTDDTAPVVDCDAVGPDCTRPPGPPTDLCPFVGASPAGGCIPNPPVRTIWTQNGTE